MLNSSDFSLWMVVLVALLGVFFLALLVVSYAWLSRKKAHESSEVECKELARENLGLKVELSEKTAQVQAERKAMEQLLANFEVQKIGLRDEFKVLSEELLRSRQEELEKTNSEGMSKVVQPLKEAFENLQRRTNEIHSANVEGQTTLKNQIETLRERSISLGQNAENLTQALRMDKKRLGVWGEQQLERLLENSGLDKHCYRREANFKTDQNQDRRPDFVIDLPDEKNLIIDSKVSLKDYMDAVSAQEESEVVRFLNRHVERIRSHIDNLAGKAYHSLPGVASPDFVFMFMPNEAAFLAAFEHDPKLFDYAFERKIALVTPTTLMPILVTVSTLWRIEKQNKSTEALADSAQKVHSKLAVFLNHFKGVGDRLQAAQAAYTDSNKTLHGKGGFVAMVDGFKDKGVKVLKELPQPASIEDGFEG